MNFRRRALIAVLSAAAPLAPLAAQSLTPYDVFVFDNFTLQWTEVNGRVAVGGNASLFGWSVGASLPSNFNDYSLVVGGNLATSGGSVAAGKTYVGGTFSNGGSGFPTGMSPVIGGPDPVNFASEAARLTGISDAYAAMTPTGTTILQWSQLNFVGNGMLNVFTVTMAQLQAGYGGYEFVTPVGATNIINVIGSSGNSALNNTGFLFACTAISSPGTCQSGSNNGTPAEASRTLWNFNTQTTLTLGGPVHGSVLAPNAAVTFGWGDVVGTVVVKSAFSNGEFYSNHDFAGTVPTPPSTPLFAPISTPEPATLTLLATGLFGIAAFGHRRRRATPTTNRAGAGADRAHS